MPSTVGMLLLALATAASAENPKTKQPLPPGLSAIQAVPAQADRLERTFDTPGAGDPTDEGAEKPDIVVYRPLDPEDTSLLVVTDLGLCRRPVEKKVCAAFRKMVSGGRPAMGDDVTASRIEDSGAATIYLAPLPGVKLAGVDRVVAYLGVVTQDPPGGEPYVYVYARRGSNLLEMSVSIKACELPVPDSYYGAPNYLPTREQGNAYYRRACVTPTVLAKARTAARHLVELFRLAP